MYWHTVNTKHQRIQLYRKTAPRPVRKQNNGLSLIMQDQTTDETREQMQVHPVSEGADTPD